MNKKTTYEILITEKLEMLPVPDMADAIWARIEAQLDTDMPEDNNDGNPPEPQGPAAGKWFVGFGLSALIVTLLTIFFLNNNKESKIIDTVEELRNNPPVENITPVIQPPSNAPPVSPVTPNRSQLTNQAGTIDRKDSTQAKTDSVSLPGTLINSPQYDSLEKISRPITIPPPSVANPFKTDTTKRKPRGVQGIGDEDYRIVPTKKDSTKNSPG